MCLFFFFNDTATTEIYTLSLHDALPICARRGQQQRLGDRRRPSHAPGRGRRHRRRSEEHTSELQSRQYLVCRLLLEKKKKFQTYNTAQQQNILTTHNLLAKSKSICYTES